MKQCSDNPREPPDAHVRRIEPGDHFIGMISGPNTGDWRPIRLRRAGDSISAECYVGPPDSLRLVRTGMHPASECDADELLRQLSKVLSTERYEVLPADNLPLSEGPGRRAIWLDAATEDQLTAQALGFVGQVRARRYWTEREYERLAHALENDDWSRYATTALNLARSKADYRDYLNSAAQELATLQAFVADELQAAEALQPPELEPTGTSL